MATFISAVLWGVLQCVALVLSFIYVLAILNLFPCEMDISICNPVFLYGLEALRILGMSSSLILHIKIICHVLWLYSLPLILSLINVYS